MKVFKVNDCDWWVAENRRDAWEACMRFYGADESCVFQLSDIVELDDVKLQKMQFFDEDNEVTRTFAEQLALRVAAGITEPEMFASTEW